MTNNFTTDFFNDCLLFKSKDKYIRFIGFAFWLGVLGVVVCLIEFYRLYGY